MKKFNLIVWMAALMGIATSCSKDDASLLSNSENSSRVSMSVNLPQEMTATRAVPTAPAGHKLRCVLEVWDKAGTTLKVRKELAQTTATDFKFEFDLTDAGDYKAVLWADYIDASVTEASGHFADKYYTTNAATGLKAVAVKTLTATDASHRDAFMEVVEFTKALTPLSLTPTLTRALTKITIAEKTKANYDLCATVKATYKVPSKINVMTKTVDLTNSLLDATYNAAPQGGVASMVLFSDYVLANADGTVGEIALEFTSNNVAKNLATVTIPSGIPAKRNWRVNASGNLIQPSDAPSTKVEMSVSVSDNFTGDENKDVVAEVPDAAAVVGDFYMKDGTWLPKATVLTTEQKTNCIGIVYVVNPDGTTGKIVGLTEGTGRKWSTEQVTTDATNLTDGRANMATIAAFITAGGKSWGDYPAFKWVAEQNGKAAGGWDAADKWYLPANEELKALYGKYNEFTNVDASVKTAVNTSLNAIGATPLSSANYWSSSESLSINSWNVNFTTGSTNNNNKTYTSYSTRCVRAF